MHKGIAWDDLQVLLAVAEQGSLAGAARALGVNHTTVLRRVNAFEAAHGIRLFERLAAGYTLTAGGEELLAAARAMSGVVADLERKLAGRDLRIEGGLRVTTTDTLMASVLPAIFAAFKAANPAVELEVSTSNEMANLTRRDADVAVRPASDPPEGLTGRRVSGIAFAVYGAPDADPASGWLAPDASLAASSLARWLRREHPAGPIAARADSFVTLRDLARAGVGLVALPCYLGETSEGLVRREMIPGLTTDLWILAHEDLRRTARVAAFTDFAARALAAQRPLFEGGAQAPASSGSR